MQIGNVGSGGVHTTNSHQVTDCVHGHQDGRKTDGSMSALHTFAQRTSTDQADDMQEKSAFGQSETAAEKVKKLIAKGRRLIGRLWNGPEEIRGDAVNAGRQERQSDDNAENEAVTQERMAAANPQVPPNPSKNGADALWQRFKLKVYTATGHLAKRFGRNTFLQTDVKGNQQQRRQDSRDRAWGRKNQEEMETAMEDRSYLMDSYDRTGKYVKLGQENGRKHN